MLTDLERDAIAFGIVPGAEINRRIGEWHSQCEANREAAARLDLADREMRAWLAEPPARITVEAAEMDAIARVRLDRAAEAILNGPTMEEDLHYGLHLLLLDSKRLRKTGWWLRNVGGRLYVDDPRKRAAEIWLAQYVA